MLNDRAQRRKHDGGFSLVEILVVIGILSTLIAIAATSFITENDRYNAENLVKEMYIDLMNARVRAMQRNRRHFVTFTATQYTVYEDTDPTPDGDQQLTIGSDAMILRKDLIAKFPITYDPNWKIPPAGEPLAFTSKGLLAALASGVTPTGVVRITPATNGQFDCLEISEIKITMGKWNGTDCKAK